MVEVVVLIYVQDEAYGKRLLRYLMGRRNTHMHAELVTSREIIHRRIGTNKQRIVVLTDWDEIEETSDKRVIHLTGVRTKNARDIFQYQKAEDIYEDLVRLLDVKEGSGDTEAAGISQLDKGIWFFLSPDGVGLTSIVTLASQYFGRQSCCLYMNLTGFPVWYGDTLCETPEFQTPGLDELLFMSAREDFVRREREIRKSMGQAFLLPPVHHYKDLLDSTKEDWQVLLQRLQEDCGYDCIVIELGTLMEHTFEMLALGDEVLMISQPNLLGNIRCNVWKQYCRVERREELLHRIRFLTLPEEWQEWEKMVLDQPLQELAENNQLMAAIHELLETERGEREHVCLWEDFG